MSEARSAAPRAGAESAVSRALEGAKNAFQELIDPYQRELQLHCYTILRSLQDAVWIETFAKDERRKRTVDTVFAYDRICVQHARIAERTSASIEFRFVSSGCGGSSVGSGPGVADPKSQKTLSEEMHDGEQRE